MHSALVRVCDRAHLLLGLSPCHLFHLGSMTMSVDVGIAAIFLLTGSRISSSGQAY